MQIHNDVCVTYSPWALLPSWFVNKLSLYHVKHVAEHTSVQSHFLVLRNKCSFILQASGFSTQTFPWMASQSSSCFSFHSPARHNAYVKLKLFFDFSTLPQAKCAYVFMKKSGEHHTWVYVQHMGSCICVYPFSISLCLFSFNTSGPNSELACKFLCVFGFQQSWSVSGLCGFSSVFPRGLALTIFASHFQHLF